jgi:hypothetical protein
MDPDLESGTGFKNFCKDFVFASERIFLPDRYLSNVLRNESVDIFRFIEI